MFTQSSGKAQRSCTFHYMSESHTSQLGYSACLQFRGRPRVSSGTCHLTSFFWVIHILLVTSCEQPWLPFHPPLCPSLTLFATCCPSASALHSEASKPFSFSRLSLTGVPQLLKCVKEMAFQMSPQGYVVFAVETGGVCIGSPRLHVQCRPASITGCTLTQLPTLSRLFQDLSEALSCSSLCVEWSYCWKEKTSCVWKSIFWIPHVEAWNVFFPF